MSKKLLSAVARHVRLFALLAAPSLVPCLATASGPETSRDAAEPDIETAAVLAQAADETDSDGDLIPDFRDPQPLVANVPVYWSVQKFSLSRPNVSEPTDTSWSSAPTLDIAAVLPAPKIQSTYTVMPLTSRKPTDKTSVHPFAPLAVFGTETLRLGPLERARTSAFLHGWRAEGANQPITLFFTVRFVDFDSRSWTFPGLEVPVVLGGKIWAMSHPKPKDPAQRQTGLLLPGDGQVRSIEFVAEIDASVAEAFLSHLASSDFAPTFDFARANGLDPIAQPDNPPPPGAYSLSAAFHSILLKTRQIRVEGPGNVVWTWRVAPVDLGSGTTVTFGQWAEIMNAVSKVVYDAPLFQFDGFYPISIAGWDNGYWDLYWSASRKGREISPLDLASSRLKSDIVLSLSTTSPTELPPEGADPVLSHLRGVWFHRQGLEDEAIAHFSAACSNGIPQSFSWCGRCKALTPDDASSPGANKAAAADLYKRAAAADYAPGLAWHGRALVHGDGVAINKDVGVAEIKKAADQGFAEGRLLYALFLKKGVGVKANSNEALTLLTEAAWQGNRPAMTALGEFLIESGSLEGRDWIELAAKEGDDKAAARFARFLRDGELGTTADPNAADAWLQRAADAGDASSLLSLGEAFRAGKGVRRNLKKAAEYFRRAAEAGSSDGMTWYALCLLEGKGVRRNVPMALEFLSRAADAGNANAKFFQGVCLFGGYGGTEPDKPRAMLCFRDSAAEQPAANVFLGVGYLNGLGLKKDEKKAVECFKAAAARDLPAGIIWLAHCHANGIGVKKDIEEARKWARKAAELGVPAGRQMLLSIQE